MDREARDSREIRKAQDLTHVAHKTFSIPILSVIHGSQSESVSGHRMEDRMKGKRWESHGWVQGVKQKGSPRG